MKKNRVERLLFLGLFLLFLPLTWLTPRNCMDDYSYAFSYDNSGQYLVTFSDFVSSMIAHYTSRHGRIWANGLASVFSANEVDWLFKLLNAFMFIAFIYMSVKVLDYDKKEKISKSSYLCIALLSWFLIPVPGETLLWMCGSLNYLWPAVFILGWMVLIKKSLVKELSYFPLLLCFAVLTGWLNEAFSVPIIGGVFFYFLLKRPHLPKQTRFLLGGFLLGGLCMIFSPGTIHRAGNSILSTDSIALALLFRIYTFGMLFIGLKIKATLILGVLLLLIRWKNKDLFHQFVQRNLLLLLITGCSIAFMVVIAYVEDRGLMGVELFSIFLLYRLLQMVHQIYANRVSNVAVRLSALAVGCIFIYDYSNALGTVYKFHEGDKQIFSDYVKVDHGMVCSPFEQKDYDSRFISYCNSVEYEEGISMYYNYHLKRWKSFHLIPKPFYEAITTDFDAFKEANKMAQSDEFCTLDDELYFVARLDDRKILEKVMIEYRFDSNSVIKKCFPKLSTLIEQFYSHTNIRTTFIHDKEKCYLFVNKFKRMLPGLELYSLSIKYKEQK